MRGLRALLLVTAAVFLLASGKPETEWKQLFNGKDLSGWKHVGPGEMTVGDGLIETHGGMGLLYWTGGKIGHFKLRVIFKVRDFKDTSGVYIPISLQPRVPLLPIHFGVACDMDNH